MKLTTAVLAAALLLGAFHSAAWATEVGAFIGGYSKDVDIEQATGDNLNLNLNNRSFTPYFGLELGFPLIGPVLELQQSFGLALNADDAVRPHDFVYGSNFNVKIPIGGFQPYVGAGVGFVYSFGNPDQNFGDISLADLRNALDDSFYLMVNFGGGIRFMLTDNLSLRLSARDYILPNYERAVISGAPADISIAKDAVHNIGFKVSLGHVFGQNN